MRSLSFGVSGCLCKLFCAALVMALIAIPALAQVPTGTILGVVKDSSGGVVAGANVTITNSEVSLTRTVSTADDGSYRVPSLPTGHYEVKAERTGFRTETQRGLTLNVSDNAVINFALQVGTSAQEVVVTSEAPLVNTANSSLGGLVNEQQMAELPLNGRNYIDLSLMQPGVTQDRNYGQGQMSGTSYSANGATVRSNYFTLDGAPVATLFGRSTTSESGNSMGVDGIKEYKVITSNFAAEYGMTMGSQMTMVSKNGTNNFHGDVFEFMRNSALDAKNFFDSPATSGSKRLPLLQRNNYGGSFGGPIRKEKTFFFAVYEGLHQKLGVTALETVPPAACHHLTQQPDGTYRFSTAADATACGLGVTPGTVIQPQMVPILNTIYNLPNVGTNGYGYPSSDITKENYGQIRVDQNLTASDTAFVRYTIQDGNLDNNGGGTAAVPSSSAAPQYRLAGQTRNQFLSLVENHIFSNVVVNTARLSYSRTAYNLVDVYTQNLISPQLSFNPGFPTGRIRIGGGAASFYSPAQDFPAYGIQNIYAFSDDVNYTRGKHSFKFGTLMNRYYDAIQQTRSRSGILSFGSLTGFLTAAPVNVELETPGSNQNRYYAWYTFGFYGQDDWRATSRLTLNIGLRYEFMTQLNELNGRQSAFRNWVTDGTPTIGPTMRDRTHLNFSPRIGFAYDLTGNGKTSIRGGFGIYYDLANIGTALQQTTLATEPFSSTTVLVNPPHPISIPFTIAPFTPGTPSSLVPQGLDYNSYQPHLVQYNLTAEHQFPAGIALSVSYAGSRGAHLWTVEEGNPEIPTPINGLDSWNNASPRVNQNLIQSGYGSSVILITTGADSWYNSLQVVASKRLSHGLQFQSSYTFGKLLDTFQGQMNNADCNSSNSMQPQDPFHPLLDKGPACFDTAHNWRMNLLYHFPTISSNGFVSKVANGWWVGNVVSVQSGYPFSPIVSNNRSLSNAFQGQSDRPDLGTQTITTPNGTFIPYDPKTVINPHPDPSGVGIDWFNPFMFQLQPIAPCPYNAALTCGTAGTASRDILRGPGLRVWDFSLVKDTKLGFLGEGGNVQFRAEFFNVLNHTNLGSPSPIAFSGALNHLGPYSEKPSATAGLITSTSTAARQIQLGLKIIF